MRTRDEIVSKLKELENEHQKAVELYEQNENSSDYEVQEQLFYVDIDIKFAKEKVDLIKWVLNEDIFPIEAIK